MYEAVTHQVKVTVEPTFDPERSDPDERRYFWRYAIEIVNLGDNPVTLMERHWRITDANGRQQDVRGPGVVGEQPTIEPGKSFQIHLGLPADHVERAHGRRVSDGRSGPDGVLRFPSPHSRSIFRTASGFSTRV